MNKLTHFAVPIVRILLGAMFLFSGLNGFFNFIPMEPPQGAAGQLMGGFAATGYFFPLLIGTETLVGLLLVAGRLVPLALIVLSPVMLNILAFHLFLTHEGLIIPLLLGFMQLYLAWAYRESFVSVLQFRAAPTCKKLKR